MQVVDTPLLHKTREFIRDWADRVEKTQKNYSKIVKRTDLHLSRPGFVSFVDAGAEVWLGLDFNQAIQKSRPAIIRNKVQSTIATWTDLTRREYAEAKRENAVWIKLSAFVDGNSDKLEFRGYLNFDEYGRDSIAFLEYMGGNPNQTSAADQDFTAEINLNKFDDTGFDSNSGYIGNWLDLWTEKALKHIKKL